MDREGGHVAAGAGPVRFDAVHRRSGGTLLQVREKTPELILGPFSDAFDAAVGAVPNPAVEPQRARPSLHEVAKADALDVAPDYRVKP